MRKITVASIGLALPLISYGADIDAGREKAQACTACHGANGISVSDEIPILAGQRIVYITNQLKAFREGTRKNPLMNAMSGQLTDTDIDNLAVFFNSLASPGDTEMSDTGKALADIRITFPDDYQETFTLYSKVDQTAQKRVRHNFVNEPALQGPDEHGMFADGTYVLTEIYGAKLDESDNPIVGDDGYFVADQLVAFAAMEKRQGWGDDIPELLRNGDWNYALFTPGKTPREGVNQAPCLACHKPLHDADYLFSYQALVEKTK